MIFLFDNPVDIHIVEVSSSYHEIKSVSKISIDYRGVDRFTIRVGYSSGEDSNYLESVFLGLIDAKEASRLKSFLQEEVLKEKEE